MKSIIMGFLLVFAYSAWADNCNLYEFKWECRMPVHHEKTNNFKHISYCGDSWVYLSTHQRAILNAYRRANVNMVLKVNGEYVDSPCN